MVNDVRISCENVVNSPSINLLQIPQSNDGKTEQSGEIQNVPNAAAFRLPGTSPDTYERTNGAKKLLSQALMKKNTTF